MNTHRSSSMQESPAEQPQSARRSIPKLEKLDPVAQLHSCFSEEEDSSFDETGQDIVDIAEQPDQIKTAREDLVLKMSQKANMTPAVLESQSKLAFPTIRDQHTDRVLASPTQPYLKAVNEIQIRNTGDKGSIKEFPKSSLLTPELSEEAEGNLDDDLSEEPPKAVMPQNMTVHSISDESKVRSDTSNNAGVLPESRAKGAIKSQLSGEGLPVLEGFLKKRKTGILKTWLKRYYVLKNKKLYYYENDNTDIKAGVIDFDLISVKMEMSKENKQIKIVPVGGSREFNLRASNEDECRRWMEALEKHIKASKGFLSSLCKTAKLKNFWKDDRISESAFLKQADSGDILLFKAKSIGAGLQRSITNSDYDHVAMLLRIQTGEIVLFEANGKSGVGLSRWTKFVKSKWISLYSKIVYRKLDRSRSEDMINIIEKFVKYSAGKKFQISAAKLLKKKDIEVEDKPNRTFFCSELVAACYKRMGLLPKDISATRYYPGDFSAAKKMQLANGAKLGDEYLIDVDT